MQIELQPSYILHTRPYRDTSMLVDALTPEFGRISLVARGVRARKTPKRNLLNPFNRLLISFQGKTDLKLLTQFEPEGARFTLTASHLFSGFYLNELLVRLLPELDAHPSLYKLYEISLGCLHAHQDLEPILRRFELQLLDELGYGIDFSTDATSHQSITPNAQYCLDSTLGFYLASENIPPNFRFSGNDILAIAQGRFESPEVKQTAKRITRILLKPLLGNKPLSSRELFS